MSDEILARRVTQIRRLCGDEQGSTEWFEAAGLAQVVLHDTVGGTHPLMLALKSALEKADAYRAVAASRGVVKLFDEGGLRNPHLAIAAFLAGAALEDALRRLCEAHGVTYDPLRASIARLQAGLFQPSRQIEVMASTENKQVTAWGDTRNKADHGKFAALTQAEVLAMVIGVRGFVDKHLP